MEIMVIVIIENANDMKKSNAGKWQVCPIGRDRWQVAIDQRNQCVPLSLSLSLAACVSVKYWAEYCEKCGVHIH